MALSQARHRWFSGRMLACHAGGPGSIPGRCKLFCGCTVLFLCRKRISGFFWPKMGYLVVDQCQLHWNWGCSSVVERSLCMWKAQGSIPCISKDQNFVWLFLLQKEVFRIFLTKNQQQLVCKGGLLCPDTWWSIICFMTKKFAKNGKKKFGESGHRSPYLSHAKRALYHLS